MTDESISEMEREPCLSKTGRVTLPTGNKSAAPSLTAPATAAKAVPSIPTAVPATMSFTPSPEAASSSLSPTSTTSPKTVTPPTSAPGASDATSLMTPNTMLEPESAALALSATTASPPCSIGRNPNKSAERSKALRKALKRNPEQLMMYQIQLENYHRFNSRVGQSVEVWGSSARCNGGEYAVRAGQIAKYCQTAGLNDPNATPEQQLAMATCLLKGSRTYDHYLGDPNGKPAWKVEFKNALEQTSAFFELGTKEMLKKQKQTRGKAK